MPYFALIIMFYHVKIACYHKTAVEVILKDRGVIHENFQAVAKKVREDCCHVSLKCRWGHCTVQMACV